MNHSIVVNMSVDARAASCQRQRMVWLHPLSFCHRGGEKTLSLVCHFSFKHSSHQDAARVTSMFQYNTAPNLAVHVIICILNITTLSASSLKGLMQQGSKSDLKLLLVAFNSLGLSVTLDFYIKITNDHIEQEAPLLDQLTKYDCCLVINIFRLCKIMFAANLLFRELLHFHWDPHHYVFNLKSRTAATLMCHPRDKVQKNWKFWKGCTAHCSVKTWCQWVATWCVLSGAFVWTGIKTNKEPKGLCGQKSF